MNEQSTSNEQTTYSQPPDLPEITDVALEDPSAQLQLLEAIDKADLKGIRSALKAGADVNYCYFDMQKPYDAMAFPLYAAIEAGDRKVIKLLLDSGAAVNFQDYTIDAVEAEDMQLLKLLLKYGAAPDGPRHWKPDYDDGGRNDTSLTTAVTAGLHTMAKTLLEAGADIEHINANGDCALMIALRNGDKRMVKLLNEFESKSHRSQIEAAYKSEIGEAAKLDKQLSNAIRDGKAEEVRRLIRDNNRDVARPLHYWDSPLLSFALLKYNEVTNLDDDAWEDEPKPGSPESMVGVVKVLLELGAPVDTKSINTPLHMGTHLCESYPEIYEAMLTRSANVDLTEINSKDTPLLTASTRGEPTAVALLLKHGADPNRKDGRGQTALDAVKFQYKYKKTPNYEKVMQLLREAGGEETGDH